MIVQNFDTLVESITNSFRANYTASTPVKIDPLASGWKKSNEERRFSEDFLKHALLPTLKRASTQRIYGDSVKDVLPDDINSMVSDFILEYDEDKGYNGTKMDLASAENEFYYRVSFKLRDTEMEARRAITVPPSDDNRAMWQKQVNAYTITPRPQYDHFAQGNDQEYKQYDTLEYKRSTVPTQKSLYVDNVRNTVSQTTQNYILNDIFTTTTTNTYKP